MLQDPNRLAVAWALDGAIRDAAYDTSDKFKVGSLTAKYVF